MWFFIFELILMLVFYTKEKEWFVSLTLAILYAILIQFSMINLGVYYLTNILLIVSLCYTVFTAKTWMWLLDVFPLILIKIFELLLVYQPSLLVLDIVPLDLLNIYNIDTIFYLTIIINEWFSKVKCFVYWNKEYIKHYTFFGLTLINFVISW
jgi:hypothetical protein